MAVSAWMNDVSHAAAAAAELTFVVIIDEALTMHTVNNSLSSLSR